MLIGWFMALTRFEPSVLRAGTMAVLALTGFTLGRRQHPVGLLAAAIVVLVLVDPFLVWSVGLWLSVGATAGVCVVGPWLAARLRGPPWWRLALGTTLGAQAGVALPSLLVFHRLPAMSVPANLLAVPVAGAVMLFGLPAGLVAGWGPAAWRDVVMLPCRVGTRWVAVVAEVAARARTDGRRGGHRLGGGPHRDVRPAAGRARRFARRRDGWWRGSVDPAGCSAERWRPGSRPTGRSRTSPTPAWSSR